MATWRILGTREGWKVTLTAKGLVMIREDVFDAVISPAEAVTETALEVLSNDEPRTFALRRCTTGARVPFRRIVRKGGEVIWQGSISDFQDQIGLQAWRGETIETDWKIEDGMLVIRVPMSSAERRGDSD